MPVLSRPVRHPVLVGLVDRVWFAAPDPVGESRVEWVLPTAKAQMILSPRSSLFAGPKVIAEEIERHTDVPVAGVSFAAGAASVVDDISAHEMCGATVPLDAVMQFGSLPDRLAEHDAAEALDVLEAELVRRLSPHRVDQGVLAVAEAICRGWSSARALDQLVGDRRSFVPDFRRMVGVGPKHFQRICRFNRTITVMRGSGAPALASIAADSGYADQAHLTREVRHFARIGASHLHRDGARMVNHVESDKIFKT